MAGEPVFSMTEEALVQFLPKLSNWAVWGKDDQRGTLNYVTPEHRRRAMASVKSGRTLSCALPIETAAPASPGNAVHWNILLGGDQVPPSGTGVASDFIGLAPHGIMHTHLDALCHIFFDALMYNRRTPAMVTSAGAQANAVTAAGEGIVTRGLLLDIPRLRGVDYLEQQEPVRRAELEAAEHAAGVRAEPGDAVLLRVGRHARVRALGPSCERQGAGHERQGDHRVLPGMDPDCLSWLHERKIALLGSDGVSDVLPSPYRRVRLPIHVGALVFMGLHLLDNAMLDELAAACAARGSWEFLFMLAPLKIKGGTCSPVNPIALL